MPTPDRRNQRLKRSNKILSYFSYAMVLLYLTLGIVLLFTEVVELPRSQRHILGGILLLYALYRGYSIYSRQKNFRDDYHD